MMSILPSTTGTPGRFKGKAPELQHCGQEFHNSRSMGLGSLHSFWTQPTHPVTLLGVKCCCSFPHSFQLFYRRGDFKSYFSLPCSLLFKVWLCGHSSAMNSSLHININICLRIHPLWIDLHMCILYIHPLAICTSFTHKHTPPLNLYIHTHTLCIHPFLHTHTRSHCLHASTDPLHTPFSINTYISVYVWTHSE